jgi:hypothetical protein
MDGPNGAFFAQPWGFVPLSSLRTIHLRFVSRVTQRGTSAAHHSSQRGAQPRENSSMMRLRLLFLTAAALVASCAPVEAIDGIHTECVPGSVPGSWTASTNTDITSCAPVTQRVICQDDRPTRVGRVLGICCSSSLTNDQARACVARARAALPVSDAGRVGD